MTDEERMTADANDEDAIDGEESSEAEAVEK